MNLYTLLELIREKPYLYIGDKKLSTLYYNINGYILNTTHNEINENLIPKWDTFNDFIAKELNYAESTSGYCRMILERNNFDEEKALIEFYKLLDIFRKA
ncbi:hypothetical protein [Flavobacterium flavigenum]|uniref:hypothetical protein n=1 Tax=Flavobacterium flavigenum TaxID=3003258 RepID=UPI0022AC8B30|nr:hypothetical protein [Flavobacterium flavigenum]